MRKTLSKEQRAELRKQMRALKKQGKDFNHLATCPCSYQVYMQVV